MEHRINAFCMGQPFASLAARGFKTLETRGWDLLEHLEGRKAAIYVANEDWPRDPRRRAALQQTAMELTAASTSNSIESKFACDLPNSNFARGQIVAYVYVGKTMLLTETVVARLGGWDVVEQRACLPRSLMQSNPNMHVTELSNACWLRYGIDVPPRRAKLIFTALIPPDAYLPSSYWPTEKKSVRTTVVAAPTPVKNAWAPATTVEQQPQQQPATPTSSPPSVASVSAAIIAAADASARAIEEAKARGKARVAAERVAAESKAAIMQEQAKAEKQARDAAKAVTAALAASEVEAAANAARVVRGLKVAIAAAESAGGEGEAADEATRELEFYMEEAGVLQTSDTINKDLIDKATALLRSRLEARAPSPIVASPMAAAPAEVLEAPAEELEEAAEELEPPPPPEAAAAQPSVEGAVEVAVEAAAVATAPEPAAETAGLSDEDKYLHEKALGALKRAEAARKEEEQREARKAALREKQQEAVAQRAEPPSIS